MPSFFHYHRSTSASARARLRRRNQNQGPETLDSADNQLYIAAHSCIICVSIIPLLVLMVWDHSETEWIVKIWYIVIPVILIIRSSIKLWKLIRAQMRPVEQELEASKPIPGETEMRLELPTSSSDGDTAVTL